MNWLQHVQTLLAPRQVLYQGSPPGPPKTVTSLSTPVTNQPVYAQPQPLPVTSSAEQDHEAGLHHNLTPPHNFYEIPDNNIENAFEPPQLGLVPSSGARRFDEYTTDDVLVYDDIYPKRIPNKVWNERRDRARQEQRRRRRRRRMRARQRLQQDLEGRLRLRASHVRRLREQRARYEEKYHLTSYVRIIYPLLF